MKPRACFLSLAAACAASLLLPVAVAHAGMRSSANYTIPADSADAGGRRATSALYTNNASAGGIAALTTVANPAETNKSGYVGQLYEIVGFTVTASPATVNESGGTRQLNPASVLDDTSLLALNPSAVTWSVVSGPLSGVSPSGLATAATVYQDTSAVVRGVYGSYNSTLSLLVLNTSTDDFGAYAGDGIDDAWQVQYFGQPPNPNAGPTVDYDGTGQSNLFKYIAGLNPLDPNSRFVLRSQPHAGQLGALDLIFNPVFADRTYTLQASPTLGAGATWAAVPNTTQSDNGNTRTLTDPNGTGSGPQKFYRVLISKP